MQFIPDKCFYISFVSLLDVVRQRLVGKYAIRALK